MEDPSNIGFVCNEHAPKATGQYVGKPLSYFKGKFVKLGFPCSEEHGGKEHMWVKVLGEVEGEPEELAGHLNNDPLFADFQNGDLVLFDRVEIEDIMD